MQPIKVSSCRLLRICKNLRPLTSGKFENIISGAEKLPLTVYQLEIMG